MPSISPASGSLGRKKAAHLLRRIGFGPTKAEVDSFAQKSIPQAVNDVLKPASQPPPPLDPAEGVSWLSPDYNNPEPDKGSFDRYIFSWWMEQMRVGSSTIAEKMVFFHHTLFTTIASRMKDNEALYYQNALFRYYALGNFKVLAKKMCLDNAMLRHLDGHLNEKGRPNENFAREFLELYTIGKGVQVGPDNYTNYTESDIQEAAKVLSGYGYDKTFSNPDPDCGIPIGIIKSNDGEYASRHDGSTKQFSAAFQNRTIAPLEVVEGKVTIENTLEELDQLVNMIFEQPETARHICRRLYRFFVYYKIDDAIENDIITPLANTFIQNDYEILPVLSQLFRSTHFYDMDNAVEQDDNIGAIIKSPLELVIGTIRFFKNDVPDYQSDAESFYEYYKILLKQAADQGLDLYEPFEVAGYAAYHQRPGFNRNWISANYLALRYQFVARILAGLNPDNGIDLDVLAYVDNTSHVQDPSDPDSIVSALVDYLLPEEIPEERYQYYKDVVLKDTLSTINWQFEWQNYKQTGDGSAVRAQIENLVIAITQSPEYQLS
jgi:uncharacterized protein (DUF1800 family)